MEEPKHKKYLNGLSKVLNAIDKPGAIDTDKIISSVLDTIKNSQPTLLNGTKKYIKGLKKLTRKKFKYYELIWTPEDKKNEDLNLPLPVIKQETLAEAKPQEAKPQEVAPSQEVATVLSPLQALAITKEKLGGPGAVAKRIEEANRIKKEAAAKEAAAKAAAASAKRALLAKAADARAAKAPAAKTSGGSRKIFKATKKRLTHKLARARK